MIVIDETKSSRLGVSLLGGRYQGHCMGVCTFILATLLFCQIPGVLFTSAFEVLGKVVSYCPVFVIGKGG